MNSWGEIENSSDNRLSEVFETIKKQGGILMQSTGLHDKNGKEIYEGDIVKSYENELVGELYYFNDIGGYTLWISGKNPKGEMTSRPFRDLDTTNLEIIGNIYQNPELLK